MCQRTRQDTTEDVVCIEELRRNTERELEFFNMIQYLPVSEATQIAIKQATDSDVTLRELKTVIREGWPACNSEVPTNIRNYFPFREELSLQNGLVFKGERPVIPPRLSKMTGWLKSMPVILVFKDPFGEHEK